MFGNRREREEVAALRAEVIGMQGRLASDISTLDPGDSQLCRQALVDAAERNTAAGGVLATASTLSELHVARRIVIEGLTATRVVREERGLSLGPDLPSADYSAAAVPTAVRVGEDDHVAHPQYHPDAPHYFGGGSVGGASAPAGYYRTPFWQKALAIGGAVAGAGMIGNLAGDLFEGGGDGGDYDGGGGDWGGGGGGDGGGWGDDG